MAVENAFEIVKNRNRSFSFSLSDFDLIFRLAGFILSLSKSRHFSFLRQVSAFCGVLFSDDSFIRSPYHDGMMMLFKNSVKFAILLLVNINPIDN